MEEARNPVRGPQPPACAAAKGRKRHKNCFFDPELLVYRPCGKVAETSASLPHGGRPFRWVLAPICFARAGPDDQANMETENEQVGLDLAPATSRGPRAAALPSRSGFPARKARWLSLPRPLFWGGIVLALALGGLRTGLAYDTGSGGADKEIRLGGADALELQAALLEQSITNALDLQAHPPAAPQRSTGSTQSVPLWIALGLSVMVAIRQFAPRLGDALIARCHPWETATDTAADILAQEKSFSEFASAFATGPGAAPAPPAPQPESSAPAPQATASPESAPASDPVKEFAVEAQADLAAIRSVFTGINRSPDVPTRQMLLADLSYQLHSFKGKAALPALLPAWQLATTLDGLVKQLVDRPSAVNPSTLRSIAGALDLLSTLSSREPKPDLATVPPVRLLAVDDDALCRHAVAFSLRKVFSQPDLAVDGESALRFAANHYYDVVFLDVEMPGMDGFELCARIHATAPNATTPVIFVTRHSEFNAQATSCATGGQDLIGKPFLPFELAVKAFTVVMRRRLQAHGDQFASPPPVPADPVPPSGAPAEASAPELAP